MITKLTRTEATSDELVELLSTMATPGWRVLEKMLGELLGQYDCNHILESTPEELQIAKGAIMMIGLMGTLPVSTREALDQLEKAKETPTDE